LTGTSSARSTSGRTQAPRPVSPSSAIPALRWSSTPTPPASARASTASARTFCSSSSRHLPLLDRPSFDESSRFHQTRPTERIDHERCEGMAVCLDQGRRSMPGEEEQVKLRPYQLECIETVEKYWEDNPTKNAAVSLPTGSGKTVIFSEIA